MSQEEIVINGELMRLRREAKGWVLNDMATRACMSVKQIRQLEEGGMSSFYSEAVKATAAKKVGALLGLSEDEVFGKDTLLAAEEIPLEADELKADTGTNHDAQVPVASSALKLSNSDWNSEHTESVDSDQSAESSVQAAASSSKKTFWLISILLLAVLSVAAYFQPQDDSVVEAAPPIQVLPVDVVDPASAASAAELSTSASESSAPAASVSVAVQKPVPTNAPASAAAASVAGVSRATTPAVSASQPTVIRQASPIIAVSAASTASKAP